MAPSSAENPMSQSGFSQYVATQEYARKTPVQRFDRRYLQLPFDYESRDQEVIPSSHDFADGEFAGAGFFDKINLSLCVRVLGLGEWKYEMRREAQEILPFLYLGPAMCVKNRDFMLKEHFTLLLSIRTKLSVQARLVSGQRIADELGIEAASVDFLDNQEFISTFPRTIRCINDHLASPRIAGSHENRQPRKILIFCESGNERSAAIVAAYLMVMFGLDAGSALYVIQQRRFCINIESSLWDILCSFESILTAKRDVERTRREASRNSALECSPLAATAKKRNLDDRDDDEITRDDMDLDEEEDARKPLAPFRDR